MCEQCSAKTIDLGEVMPGYMFVKATVDGNMMKKGDYGLVVSNDPDVVFRNPMIDITEGMSDEEVNNLQRPENKKDLDKWMEFGSRAEEFEKTLLMLPSSGYELYKAAMEVGYNREKHGRFSFWLFDYLARFIEKRAK